mgnify:CR=1 FL=1
MPVTLSPWNDDLRLFLEGVVSTQAHQEHAGQIRIEVIVDVQITVFQQVDVLLHHEGVVRVCKPTVHHCSLKIASVMEPKDHTVTTLFIRYEQYTT